MEQHPVPRNISGFQFRLVGDMTLRQFIYLAVGGVGGYLLLKAPFPSFLKFPLAFFSFFAGIAFAFIPIQERPLDTWVRSFLKSIYSPTQFIWKKEEEIPEIFTRFFAPTVKKSKKPHVAQFHESKKKLEEYLKTLPQKPSDVLEKKEINRLKKTLSLFQAGKAFSKAPLPPVGFVPPPSRPGEPPPVHFSPKKIKKGETVKEEKKPEKPKVEEEIPQLEKKTTSLTKRVEDLKKELGKEKVSKERFLELQQKLTNALREQERLIGELARLRKTLEAKQIEKVVHPKAMEIEEAPRVKMVTPKFASKIGLPKTPSVPNLVSGVIKTAEGELLPSIIITLKDKEDTPVRALKTNRLGQFAISTPLKRGTYTMEIADPQNRYKFDIIEINLTDELFPPLEITAKSEKELMKERLAKELFRKEW